VVWGLILFASLFVYYGKGGEDMTESIGAVARPAGLENSSINNYQVLAQVNNRALSARKIEASQTVPVDRIVQALESYIDSNKRSLDISVDNATGDIVVKVISDEDGKVIREIPSEEVLKRAATMEQLAGLVFDQDV
jgi:uncharacterized FlaG/YvyC family protein